MKKEITKINEKIALYETLIKGLTVDSHESDDNQERIAELQNIIKGLYVALLIVDKKFRKRCKRAKKILFYTDESELVTMVRIIDKFVVDSEVDELFQMVDHLEGVEVLADSEYTYTVANFIEVIK